MISRRIFSSLSVYSDMASRGDGSVYVVAVAKTVERGDGSVYGCCFCKNSRARRKKKQSSEETSKLEAVRDARHKAEVERVRKLQDMMAEREERLKETQANSPSAGRMHHRELEERLKKPQPTTADPTCTAAPDS